MANVLELAQQFHDALHDMTPKLPKDELEAIMEWGND